MSEHGHDHPPAPGVLGLLDGEPVPIGLLEERIAKLRRGPRAAALPAPGSAEDRQLRRWVAQVILTERMCAADHGDAAAPPVRLDPRAAVEFGSINAAAFEGHPAVRRAYERVTASVTAPAEQVAAYTAATRHRAEPPPAAEIEAHVRDAERRRVFVIWLDRQRRERLELVDGLEHPGDPSQPDNHHKH